MANEQKKDKKKTKIEIIRSCVDRGWKDLEKIANEAGAKLSTVKRQSYLYRKELGQVVARPRKKKE